MPFYNIAPTEAMGIAEYGERTEDPKTGSGDTAFLDHVVRLIERQLYRYALGQRREVDEAIDDENKVDAPREQCGDGKEKVPVAATTSAVTVERPMPYPSLFLNTPHALVRCSWASTEDVAARAAEAAPLSRRLPHPPPTYLLATTETSTAATGASTSMSQRAVDVAATAASDADDVNASRPSWADVSELARRQQPPHLVGDGAQTLATAAEMPGRAETRLPYAIDLSRDHRARACVSVVLQGEVGLALSAPPTPDALASAHKSETFLMSPDATSCVLLACRVGLHPRWRLKPCTVPATTTGAGEEEEDDAARVFAEMCLKTFTSSMAHFDAGSDDMAAAMHDMPWRGAIPAWLHAVIEHYARTVKTPPASRGDTSPGDQADGAAEAQEEMTGTAAFCEARLKTAEEALSVLQAWLVPAPSSASAHTSGADDNDGSTLLPDLSRAVRPEDAPLSLLHVEWYVVGGIRMRQHAGPTLGRLFRTFFPVAHGPDGASTAVLSTERALADVLCHAGGQGVVETPAAASSSPSPRACTVTVQHRLREDGLCFWSLNTYVSDWAVDTQNPNRRYAFPMCFGLLLRLEDGVCWPVKVQPGTRGYPYARIRQVLGGGVRWTAPREVAASDCAQREWCLTHGSHNKAETANERKEGKGRNADELATGLLVSTRLVSAVPGEGAKVTLSARDMPTRRLITLCWYVRRCLAVLARRCAQAALGETREIFPLVLSTRVPWQELTPASSAHMLTMPDVFFLQFSTTPHCEPEDFSALMRINVETMLTWKNADVFMPNTDGLLVDGDVDLTM